MRISLDRYAFRSFKQVLLHALVAIGLAVILHFLLSDRITIVANSFVSILSAIATISGALLAISLALFFFFSRHIIDWRDKLTERLAQARVGIRTQMEKSALHHPEISRHLAPLYDKSVRYTPGQTIDMKEIEEADKFIGWATEQAKRHARELDPGDLAEYNSFELQLRDAYLCNREIKHTLRLLSTAELQIRATTTFSPLIIAWVIILIFTLAFAIIGGTGVIIDGLHFPILVIPLYLFLMAVFALMKDIVAIMSFTRIQETAYDQAIVELASRSDTKGEDTNKNEEKKQ